jgi:hypothetical protein
LYLVSRGVPYDIAFGLDDAERMAHVVTFGRLDGYLFDWKKLRWSEASELF